MRANRPSNTATWVALWRGLGSLESAPVAPDPTARALVPTPYRLLLDAAGRVPRVTSAALEAVHFVTRGRTRHLPLRTRAIDEHVKDAVHAGARQLVLLGAGLDGRAWRLEGIEDVRVFEIDHPATQSYKRARVEGLPPRARDVVFVGVDFETQDLATRLAEHGHDPKSPTVLVWEGVTMYLTRPAIEATMRAIASRCAPGSTLVLTYQTHVGYRALELVVRVASEPFRSYFETSEMHALLGAHGFDVVSDTSNPEWTARWLGDASDGWAVERVACARLGASE